MSLVVLAALPLLADPSSGTLIENVVTQADPGQTYTLFLPADLDPTDIRPLLLVFDPRGRGTFAAEIFREAAGEFGWILMSSNGTRSDVVDDDPNGRALRAILPEIARYPVDPARIYAAGFSGTVPVAWTLGIRTGELAGIIAVGARHLRELPPATFPFPQYGFAGETDFNNSDMRGVHAELERAGRLHRFEQFPGSHAWIPDALGRDAIAWFEVLAMKDGKRRRDDALLATLFERDTLAAALAEADGRKLEALRRLRAILRTYEGLMDVGAVRASIAMLEKDPAVKRAERDEKQADRFEELTRSQVFAKVPLMLASFREGEAVPTPARFSSELRIADLTRRASRDGAEAMAARRLLESIHVQLSFYLMRDFFARREYSIAAASLGAALEIHPDRPHIWYNLGAAQARMGDKKHALQSLGKAIELGYADASHLLSDDDYATLRDDERFQALVANLAE